MTITRVRYAGKTFPSKRTLIAHLATITGRTESACRVALLRFGDPARVIAHYRAADTRAAEFHYNGLTFPDQKALARHMAPLVGRSVSICAARLREFDNDAERLVEHYRQLNDTVDFSTLAQELRGACQVNGFSRLDDLTVLTSEHDPYRFDHPTGRANAHWFADVVARFIPRTGRHLRGLHYVLVSRTALVLKPDGTPYRNTFADWIWLTEDAAAAGRWLGLVPFELILDERNDPPVLPDEEEAAGRWRQLIGGAHAEIPDLDMAMPEIGLLMQPQQQPYRIILYGEKSSLAPVLRPIRDRVNGELLLPTGESTTTMVFNLARRCVADGRPAVIGYFSDFDPSGWQMAISVARKLQALKTLCFPTLDIRLYPVALSFEQVSRLDLPSTPLKDTEKRSDKWRAAWNHEQTEIDALAVLNPAELTRLAEEFIRPFFDPTLAERTAEVARAARDTAATTLAAHPQYRATREAIAEALANLDAANGDLAATQEQAMEELGDIELPELPELPEPMIEVEVPAPLFDSREDYAAASLKLKRHRALYPDADE